MMRTHFTALDLKHETLKLNKPLKIPHALLTEFILYQKIAPELVSRINIIRKIDPAYDMLFILIYEASQTFLNSKHMEMPSRPPILDEVENLLINLISGSSNSIEKRFFITLLISNSEFYKKLMALLSKLAAGLFVDSLPKNLPHQFQVKSDEELLQQYVFCY